MDADPVTARVMLEDHEAEELKPCRHCGQSIDDRDLTQILYHRTPQHEPLKLH